MNILLTGGGSAGHIAPNLVLARELVEQGHSVSYIGERHSLEQELCSKDKISFYGIYAGKLRRYFSLQNISDLFKLPVGLTQCLIFLMKYPPDRIFSKGGYVSVPVITAAWLLRIPVVIHESDIRPGLATRLGARFAESICISWNNSKKYFSDKHNLVLTGIPVDKQLLEGQAESARTACNFDEKPVLLIMGGSLGAHAINTLIWDNLTSLLRVWNIIHLTGRGKLNVNLQNITGYVQHEFVRDELADILSLAEVIITRAGATALAEFEYLGKKLLIIPLPLASSRGDQIENAKEYAERYPKSTTLRFQEHLTWQAVEQDLTYLLQAKAAREVTSSAATCVAELLTVPTTQP